MLLIIVFNLISLAKGLLEGSGTFSDGVLSQVTWEDELDGGLDVAAGDGVLSLVSVQLGSLQSDSLEFEREIELGVLPGDLEHFVGKFLDHLGPGVVILINPVTESHQLTFPFLHALDDLRHFLL